MKDRIKAIVLVVALVSATVVLLVVIANMLFGVEPAGHWFEIVGIIWAISFLLSEALSPTPSKTP